jgi:hypothetical protein
MNSILQFYLEDLPAADFAWNDFLSWDDEILEHKHDYIQWVFPLIEPSQCQLHTPVLTADDANQLSEITYARLRQIQAFKKMRTFYGFEPSPVELVPVHPFKIFTWIGTTGTNHNYLRLTRIMKSLCLFNNRRHALRLYQALLRIQDRHGVFPQTTLRFWADSVKG